MCADTIRAAVRVKMNFINKHTEHRIADNVEFCNTYDRLLLLEFYQDYYVARVYDKGTIKPTIYSNKKSEYKRIRLNDTLYKYTFRKIQDLKGFDSKCAVVVYNNDAFSRLSNAPEICTLDVFMFIRVPTIKGVCNMITKSFEEILQESGWC